MKTKKLQKVASSDCVPYLQALGDEKRWQMVRCLFGGPMSVSDIAQTLGIQQPSATKHLANLRKAGIVEANREGKEVMVSLNPCFLSGARLRGDSLELGCCSFQFGDSSR